MSTTSRESIDHFLASNAFAVIGVSANQRKFGNVVFRTMKEKEAVVHPVHPTLENVEGATCYNTVGSLPKEVTSVVTVVPPPVTLDVVKQCAARGISQVWMQPGSESPEAIAEAKKSGMNVVSGECILMFLEPVKSVHAFHRVVKKVFGKYPK
jgi:uncharacterized protein